MPARKDLAEPIWVGNSFAFPLRFLEEGVVKSLEGRTLTFMIKRSPSDPDDQAILTYVAVIPVGDPDGINGDHIILLQPSETSQLSPGILSFQVVLVTPAAPEDLVVTYLWGRACIKDS